MSATKPPGQEQDPAPDKPLRQEDFITEDGVFDFEAATEAVERRNTARRQREKLLEGDPRRRFGRPRESTGQRRGHRRRGAGGARSCPIERSFGAFSAPTRLLRAPWRRRAS